MWLTEELVRVVAVIEEGFRRGRPLHLMAMAALSCTRLPLPCAVAAASHVECGSTAVGRAAGFYDLDCRRISCSDGDAEKSRRRLEIVQQERNPNPCATPLRSRSSRSVFAVVQAALTPEHLNSVKDYNSALLSCVRYGHLCLGFISAHVCSCMLVHAKALHEFILSF
jgi:hypothetical protein